LVGFDFTCFLSHCVGLFGSMRIVSWWVLPSWS
jgi:hypothetical protein